MLERIWKQHQSRLRALAGRIASNPDSAEDVLQDSFARVLRAGKTFQTEGQALAFVRRTIVNTNIDHYRRRRAQRLGPGHALLSSTQVSDSRAYRELGYQDPLERLLAQEAGAASQEILKETRKVLRELKPEQRQAIEAFFSTHRGAKQFCRENNIPYSTLRSRMLVGIDLIRKHLNRKGLLAKVTKGKS